jgi:nitroreductase/NAD-dependent dihydropyrimidine dehydrogenase PreA subunit
MALTLTIGRERCTSCGACVRECPEHLQIASGTHVDHDHLLCLRCLHCYAVCPAGAIVVTQPEGAVSLEPESRPDLAPETLERFLAYRRSTRLFEDRPVPQPVIERILHAACTVPSGGNRHAYRFTVLTDDRVKQRLSREFVRVYRARHKILGSTFLRWALRPFVNPYTRAFLRDQEYGLRIKTLLDRLDAGEDAIFYSAPVAIVVHCRELIPTPVSDGILAAYHIVLMAESLGLGTCFVTFAKSAINESRTCKTMLGLSRRDTVHAVVVLGYPDVRYRRPVPKGRPDIHWV